ncbi:MAG: thermonuclease family protein [Planctomycetia bacterium]|nr:thermonuclease family protein [Planctomycetia bacterium]
MIQKIAHILLFTLVFSSARADIFATVVAVVDGDTIKIRTDSGVHSIRFQSIDAPESNQEFGKESKEYLAALLVGQSVRVEVEKADGLFRLVGRVWLGEMDIEKEMLLAGLAWHYRQYNAEAPLAEAQTFAREARRGLWILEQPVAPWEWRKGVRPTKSAQRCYWASEERVLHNSACHFYETSRGYYTSRHSSYRDCQKCGGKSTE